MSCLNCELHFWTTQASVFIKGAASSCYRYYDKYEDLTSVQYIKEKRLFCESKGLLWTPKNKWNNKLKDNLAELEEFLYGQIIVDLQWLNLDLCQIMLSSGLVIYVNIVCGTADVEKITFDKYLIGRIPLPIISASRTEHHIILTTLENRFYVFHLTRPSYDVSKLEKLGNLEPKLNTFHFPGPPTRRIEKKISNNTIKDRFLVWWQRTNEVIPWSPNLQDEDHSNLLVYSLQSGKAELQNYFKTEHPPINIMFSSIIPDLILSVEQQLSKKYGFKIYYNQYDLSEQPLHKTSIVVISLDSPAWCHSYNTTEEKICIGCANGDIIVYDRGLQLTYKCTLGLSPVIVSWHPSSSIVIIVSDKGHLQVLDVGLSKILLVMGGERREYLDLSIYFRFQSKLESVQWSKGNQKISLLHGYNVPSSSALFVFERGPLMCMKMSLTRSAQGQITIPELISQYMRVGEGDKSLNILKHICWNSLTEIVFSCLNVIFNTLVRYPLSSNSQKLIEAALGTFYHSPVPLLKTVLQNYGDKVRQLTRRYFYCTLRQHFVIKAYKLAIDLQDPDLFMDLYHYGQEHHERDLSMRAKMEADRIYALNASSIVVSEFIISY